VIEASVGEGRHREAAARMLDVACACVGDNPKSWPTAQQVEWLDTIATSVLPWMTEYRAQRQ
jgi:hypothetical protein